MLPAGFRELLTESFDAKTASELMAHLEEEPSVSVRTNTSKITVQSLRAAFGDLAGDAVAWCDNAFYLRERPSFTFDPLFHSGAYYVQEASSMYVGKLLRGIMPPGGDGLRVLDLCAAPGGKTTDILSLLGPGSLLVANEVMRARATVLAENVAKWGRVNTVVTNDDPDDFKPLEQWFDIIVVDAPCSGEGMFRKDEEAVAGWSEDNVKLCAARQRRILSDIWSSLADGGYMIYSTCTFNHYEDEDNAIWIADTLGAEVLEQRHFLPGRDRGEGFYCVLLRKSGTASPHPAGQHSRPHQVSRGAKAVPAPACPYVREGYRLLMKNDVLKAYPAGLCDEMTALESVLRVIRSGVAVAAIKGHDMIPEADLALSEALSDTAFPKVELNREDALRFLAKEPLLFPESPKGFLLLMYSGLPLGFVKNLGNRSNNLHPVARRIRKSIN